MIIGIGHDLADIQRVAGILEKETGQRFVERVLIGQEREIAASLTGRRLAEFVAGRFAVKEAVVKALGCGIGAIAGLHDIEVGRDPLGKPEVRLSSSTKKKLGWQTGEEREALRQQLHVTITHERGLASAFVVIEQLPAMQV
ncbi:holo-acyl-carrier-protein synthase [Paenibacillus curdlanolyticus YK9]|uniref:Holo-[acyl-carrier-protein] synthase n=1 Tax=Paenibacillus curdlanolyticus YK9 TaxID=717606 RepID=E0I7H9_9BACL|nr:holo-ACP synthase [Paenibacillus curdlanolyticus]EFM11995.1 holo-acyl-carrier-protein synthase [Paenibacillus curdlanolyticus YK9]